MENKYLWKIKDSYLLILIAFWGVVSHSFLITPFLFFIVLAPKFIKRRLDFSIRWTEWVHFLFLLSLVLMGGLFYLNKQKTNFFEDLGGWLPLFASLYIIEYYWSSGKDYVWKRKGNKKVKVKKPEYLQKRKDFFNFSFPSKFNTGPVIYPKALFLLMMMISILSSLNEKIDKTPTGIATGIAVILCFFVLLLNIKEVFVKKTKKEISVFVIMIAVVSGLFFLSYTVILDSVQNYQRKHSWSSGAATWFNPEFNRSSIGEEGSYTSSKDVLLRIIWKEEPGSLLPASYYDMTMDGKDWQTNLGGNNVLVNDAGSRTIPVPNTLPLVFSKLKNEEYWTKQLIQKKSSLSFQELKVEKTKDDRNAIIIGTPLKYRNGRTYLPVPYNTHTLLGAEEADMSISSGGNILYSGFSGEINLQALYSANPEIPLHSPSDMNLTVPKNLDLVLKKVIEEADLKQSDPPSVNVIKLKMWYRKHFSYTLDLDENGKPRTIENFLMQSRRGHCEFFATTSALVLRELGIPTKYVLGFSVKESHPSEEEGMYWVRARDKHAWTLYWDGKAWRSVDMTVPMGEAADGFDLFSSITDSISTIQYKISKIDISTFVNNSENTNKLFIALFVIIGAVLFLSRKKWKKSQLDEKELQNIHKKEKAFLKEMTVYLEKYPKKENEPWGVWAERTKDDGLNKIVNTFYSERYKKD